MCNNEIDFVASEDNFFKKVNNIYISKNQIEILKKYDIDVYKYSSVLELIYTIETYLNGAEGKFEDLEWVSESLSEYNYYNNTNK